MPDFYYYKNCFYGNNIPSEIAFKDNAEKAKKYILSRINVGCIKKDMFDCVCAIAEVFFEEENNNYQGVTSESIGGWKRTFDIRERDKIKSNILHDYLFMKGYLYCGI